MVRYGRVVAAERDCFGAFFCECIHSFTSCQLYTGHHLYRMSPPLLPLFFYCFSRSRLNPLHLYIHPIFYDRIWVNKGKWEKSASILGEMTQVTIKYMNLLLNEEEKKKTQGISASILLFSFCWASELNWRISFLLLLLRFNVMLCSLKHHNKFLEEVSCR